MTSPVDRISGPSRGVVTGEPIEGKDRYFDEHRPHVGIVDQPQFVELGAEQESGRDSGQRHSRRLGHERDRATRSRVHLDDVDLIAGDGELDVHQSDYAEIEGQASGPPANLVESLVGYIERRQHARRIARMHTGLLDVLQDATDHDLLTVA